MKKQSIDLIEQVSSLLTVYQAMDEYQGMNEEEQEFFNVLWLVYDVLTLTKMSQSILVKQPEEAKEPGNEDEFVTKYGITASELPNMAFNLATKQGSVDMRRLLHSIMYSNTKTEIASGVGIRINTISDYMNEKTSMTVDNYEKIINYILCKDKTD